MTEDAVRFQTVEDAAIPAGEISVTAAAEAVESGSSGNVGAGAVCVLTACPVAVRAVTNAEAFVGGISEESDDELRQRILDSFLRLPNGMSRPRAAMREWRQQRRWERPAVLALWTSM